MTESFDRTSAGPAVLDVDRLLREFYRSELPDPWPRLALPRAVRALRPAPRFGRNFLRFALAASVMLALFGYWALAGLFTQPGTVGIQSGPELMQKPGHHLPLKHLAPLESQTTPAGKDAQAFEEDTPDGAQRITIIGPSNSKSPR
jgi:hypothetical protein